MAVENTNKGFRRIAGARGTLHWDGDPIFEVTECNADLDLERGDVQIGLDVDSKITGIKGSGSLRSNTFIREGLKS